MSVIAKKVCLVGNFGVGKTSLIRRFVDRQFTDQYLTTVGVKLSRKLVERSNAANQTVQLLIWDIEGHTKFKAIAPNYFRGASGAVMVADVTRNDTLEQLSEHLHNFWTVNPNGYISIALNKADLVDCVTLERLSERYHAVDQLRILALNSTSAKTGMNVDRVFQILADKLIDSHDCAV